jgi:hypothetical protein
MSRFVRFAKLCYRKVIAAGACALIDQIPHEGVTILTVRVGGKYTLQVHVNADRSFSVRCVICICPQETEVWSTHATLGAALHALDLMERNAPQENVAGLRGLLRRFLAS